MILRFYGNFNDLLEEEKKKTFSLKEKVVGNKIYLIALINFYPLILNLLEYK